MKTAYIHNMIQKLGIGGGSSRDFLAGASDHCHRQGTKRGRKIPGKADAWENQFLSRVVYILLTALLAQGGVAYAASKTPDPLEQIYINQQIGVLTPAASPQTEGIRTWVSGDFLYWMAQEDFLEYDFLSEDPDLLVSPTVHQPKFQWDPGFRIGLGYRLPHDMWQLSANWTRFHTQAKNSIASTPTTFHLGVWVDQAKFFDDRFPVTYTAHWNLGFDLLDVGLHRSFFLGTHLDVDLSFGASGVWIHQKYDVSYPNLVSLDTEDSLNVQLAFKNNYNAGGLFLSARPEWNVCQWLSLVGNVSTHVMHGTFSIDQEWFNMTDHVTDLQFGKDYRRTRFGVQGALGLQAQTSPLNRNYHMSLTALYEGALWFNQNLFSQIGTFTMENYERRGDLGLQGFSLSARVDF